MDNLASGTNKQFTNLLDAVAAEPLPVDDGLPTLTALGPCVGDDGPHGFRPDSAKEDDEAWTLTALGPSVGDDIVQPALQLLQAR